MSNLSFSIDHSFSLVSLVQARADLGCYDDNYDGFLTEEVGRRSREKEQFGIKPHTSTHIGPSSICQRSYASFKSTKHYSIIRQILHLHCGTQVYVLSRPPAER